MEVAITPLPVRVLVALDDFHLHVDGQEVVAGMRAVIECVSQKELSVKTLPHQTTQMIGECDDDRVNLVTLDALSQFFEVHRPSVGVSRPAGSFAAPIGQHDQVNCSGVRSTTDGGKALHATRPQPSDYTVRVYRFD